MKYNKNENKYQDLKIWYSNVTSLNNKLELLKYELVHNKIDIAFVSETWWKETSLKNIRGYSVYHKSREDIKGGGVCIYVNNKSLKSYEQVDTKFIPLLSEQIWCVISNGVENILCGCIYRPPVNNKQDSDSELVKILAAAVKTKYDGILICGDFNHPTIKWTDEGTPYIDYKGNCTASGRFFENVLIKLKLYQHVKDPTFYNGKENSSILDLIFSDCNDRVNNIIHDESLKLMIQGHHILRFQYVILKNKFKQGQINNLNYTKGDYKSLNEFFDLVQDSWVSMFKNRNIDECLNIFMNVYTMGVQKYIPLINHNSKYQLSWQSNEFKKLINQKKRLWNSIIRKRFQLSDSNQMLINYKLLKRNVRFKFKKELKDYENGKEQQILNCILKCYINI